MPFGAGGCRGGVRGVECSYGAGKSALTKVVGSVSTETTPSEKYLAAQRSDDFVRLRRTLRGFVFPMTAVFFIWYALYVLLSAYARGFMGIKLVGNLNMALLFGILQFVSTFLIAWYYARFAARDVDPLADKIRDELDGEVN